MNLPTPFHALGPNGPAVATFLDSRPHWPHPPKADAASVAKVQGWSGAALPPRNNARTRTAAVLVGAAVALTAARPLPAWSFDRSGGSTITAWQEARGRAGPSAEEQALIAVLRPGYDQLLRKAGAKFRQGSPDWERALAATAGATLAARPEDCVVEDWLGGACGARSFAVPATSMAPTLQPGDVFLAEPLDGPRPLVRGDIVVYRGGAGGGTVYVKRVIGLPGERVAVRGGLVQINGVSVPREATGRRVRIEEAMPGSPVMAEFAETLPGGRRILIARPADPAAMPEVRARVDEVAEVTVPAGRYYMMGDNRLNSVDSRLPAEDGGGLPAASDLLGRARIITLSREIARIGRWPQ